MSHAPANNPANLHWQPTCSLALLRARAQFMQAIRAFFATRNVLEVSTPSLSQHGVTDVFIESFKTDYQNQSQTQTYYLQTSPEYAMKRLLAAGSGSIYQICKAFRNGEHGKQHNPEFTMLEWYQIDYDHHDLMHTIDTFLQQLLQTPPAIKITYAELFLNHLQINPHTISHNALASCVKQQSIHLAHAINEFSKDDLLQLLMTHILEPKLGFEAPCFIYDFPISQAALAKIRPDTTPVAERFELYIKGVEVANGFHELTDATEQQQRFSKDQQRRTHLNLPSIPIDPYFLAALQSGLPACAGAAIGIDRLLMLKMDAAHIHEVLAFPWETA